MEGIEEWGEEWRGLSGGKQVDGGEVNVDNTEPVSASLGGSHFPLLSDNQ